MKTIRALSHHRMVLTFGAALLAIVAVPAIVDLVIKVLGLAHGSSLPTWLLDVGENSTAGGAAGGAGAAAAGASDPTKFQMPSWWPADSDSSSAGGNGSSGGGSGGPDQPPWWQKWIPSSWTSVGAGPISIDVATGQASVGETVDLGHGLGLSGQVSAGAAPGSDPHGALVNGSYTVGISTPLGSIQTSGTVSAGISQQVQQSDSAIMGSLGTLTGASLRDGGN